MSNFGAEADIISIPQQEVAKVIGQTELLLAQL
jgi:hypothetical protein